MSGVSIQISGLNEVIGHNTVRGIKLKSAIKRMTYDAILVVQRQAKLITPVDTGRMRASIGGGSFSGGSFSEGEGIERGDNFASIGPTVVYAKYVHARRPFMDQGLSNSMGRIKSIIREEISKALK